MLLWLVVILHSYSRAQDPVSVRSDILYEISADSLYPKNIDQDLTLSVSNASNEQIDVFIVQLDNINNVLWTVVSADLDNQPLWLITGNRKPERSDILAWEYDQENKNLKLYPPNRGAAYKLTTVLRLNLLKSQNIRPGSSTNLNLIVQSGGSLSRCSTNGSAGQLNFR